MPDTEIPRDRWQRPLIIPQGGGDPIAYTRVSTLAKALDDLNPLMAWKARKTAQGLLMRPDLMTRLSGALANAGDSEADWPTKREFNAVVGEACEAAGVSTGASAGTGIHALTEALDTGKPVKFASPDDLARLDAYRAATADLEVLEVEMFVVNDEVRAAGTLDRLVRLADGAVVVADIKSGKSEPDYPLATAMQIATYANGHRYDPETGERTPLHPELDVSRGALIHMPPSGGCFPYLLDLTRGWHAVQLAAQVRDVRSWKADDLRRAVAS